MPDFDFIHFLTTYGGVILGAILLIGASLVLPGSVRKYVLTAGIAVLLYRAYQLWTNRKRLAEADAERDQLRKVNAELNSRLTGLQAESEAMRQKKIAIEAEQARLKAESDKLAVNSADTIAKKAELDQKVGELQSEGEQLQNRRDAYAAALNKAAELGKKYAIE
ncbi:hypothetical protein [Halioxenophilus sp. WMMB6]|uniref:hypothetical protein n=1 Tax=Halioxenophilus sp. WMMB6 TaxID=3073815 RepID=UPI00295E6E0E|nr:hypothetical protein [Halioxenophilus sp. WMMB6]